MKGRGGINGSLPTSNCKRLASIRMTVSDSLWSRLESKWKSNWESSWEAGWKEIRNSPEWGRVGFADIRYATRHQTIKESSSERRGEA